jgi:hypothetical protein
MFISSSANEWAIARKFPITSEHSQHDQRTYRLPKLPVSLSNTKSVRLLQEVAVNEMPERGTQRVQDNAQNAADTRGRTPFFRNIRCAKFLVLLSYWSRFTPTIDRKKMIITRDAKQ